MTDWPIFLSTHQSKRAILSAACLYNDISGSLSVVSIGTIFRFTTNYLKRKLYVCVKIKICAVYKRNLCVVKL